MIMMLLTPAEVEWLSRPIRGRGGFQSLLRALTRHRTGNIQRVPDHLAERIHRYANKYGEGGFQGRLHALSHRLRGARNEDDSAVA